ncbi:hypothetical protein BD770DRAFT_402140 [Pilaira anomala]|nr:hypothetical protein BD770DRAFT_402140 [Pilaira anomala]
MNNVDVELNVPEFWEQPENMWRNITKYDFRFYYQSGCTGTKGEAHQSYKKDIKCMSKKVPFNSNKYKMLKSCETVAKTARNNHVNKHFWDNEINNIAKIVSDDLYSEKEIEILNRVTDLSVKRKPSHDEIPTTIQAKRLNKQETLVEKFMKYKQKIVHDIATKSGFNLETNLSELAAVSNVMLLKPSQFGRYAPDHFTDEVLNEWHKSILSTLIVDIKEVRDISMSLDDLIYDLQKKINTLEVVQKSVATSVGKDDHRAQILIGLSNL